MSNGVGKALAFVASVAIARILGLQSFGLHAAIMAVVFVLGLFWNPARDDAQQGNRRLIRIDRRAAQGFDCDKAFSGGTISLILALPLVAATLAPIHRSRPRFDSLDH